MLEKALVGSKKYYLWLGFLGVLILVGFCCYIKQFFFGLGITGMSRSVSWGFYVAQFTYLVGIAASAVMVVLPYYLHNYKEFGKMTILGEFLAIAAVTMCILFILVDLGQVHRVMNVLLHPTPHSVMFYDMIVLSGYLMINIICGWSALHAEYKGSKPPAWVKPFVYLSIPWAFSIHTVTAFLYSGMPGRDFWLTAIMAPRFLASAFCAGPSLLLLLTFILKGFTRFDPGDKAIKTLAKIITYAFLANIFFFLCEVFTALYSHIPAHRYPLEYLFVGLHGHGKLVPWIWTSWICAAVAVVLLVPPKTRNNFGTLAVACILVILSTWIDKGMGLIVGGFVPDPLDHVMEYMPTLPEIGITIGVYAIGFLILSLLYKIAITVKEQRGLI